MKDFHIVPFTPQSQRDAKADRILQDHTPYDPNSFSGRLKRFVELEKERRELESRVKLIQDEAVSLKESIGEELENDKLQGKDSRARVDGLTVFLKYQTFARPLDGDMARLCSALSESGIEELERLVHPTVDLKALSELTKEMLDNAAEHNLPDEFIFPETVMQALHISTTRYVQSRVSKMEKGE